MSADSIEIHTLRLRNRILAQRDQGGVMTTPTYTNNLSQTPNHVGLKTIKITGDVVVTTGGTQLVCTACEAPFTIDQWLMRSWRQNGDLYHEECDGAYRAARTAR